MSEEPTNDLEDFVGDNPMRESYVKKKMKLMERIEKLLVKLTPLQQDVDMYDKMIAAIDERNLLKIESTEGLPAASDNAAVDSLVNHPERLASDMAETAQAIIKVA